MFIGDCYKLYNALLIDFGIINTLPSIYATHTYIFFYKRNICFCLNASSSMKMLEERVSCDQIKKSNHEPESFVQTLGEMKQSDYYYLTFSVN